MIFNYPSFFPFPVPVCGVRDCEDVRRHLVPLLALVQLDDLFRVDGQALVRVHHHAEEAGVRLEKRGRGAN